MSRTALQSLAVVALFAGCVNAGFAQAAPGDAAATLQQEISLLNRSMEQLVVLLRENLEAQRTELLLKRIELSRLDLTPIENELRALRGNRDALVEERDQIQSRLEEIEEQLAARREEIPQGANEELLMVKRDHEGRVKFLKDRIHSTELRIIEVENDLSSKRRQIEALASVVDERLGLRR